MFKHKIPLLLAVATIVSCGCSIEPPPQVGQHCVNAEYYSDNTGIQQGSLTNPEDPFYLDYQSLPYCPFDYPICATDAQGLTFCHQECPNNQVFCKNGCVDASQDKDYCGAKGFCSNPDPASENYMGEKCAEALACKEGICACNSQSQILCGEECINPGTNNAYCGARGTCSEEDPNSQNYIGMSCPSVQNCIEGNCVCEPGEILCNNKCINPDEHKDFCGAKGTCTDDDPDSLNYHGLKCPQGFECRTGECKITCVVGQHGNESNDLCVQDDNDNCGEVGKKCDEGQMCSNGQCATECGNNEATCQDQNGQEICAIPETSSQFCGADLETCLGATPCSDRQECSEGHCICRYGYHYYIDPDTSSETAQDFCEPNDNENCGEHGVVCDVTKVDNSLETQCTPGAICEAIRCDVGFHLFEGQCEPNNDDNCGEHDVPCIPRSVLNSSTVACSLEGICEATSCQSGYHIFEGKCEKDDNDNCGSHGVACTTGMVDGSATVSCSTGQCLAVTCDNTHILNGTVCIERDCTDGQTKCINSGTTGKIYKCQNNVWKEDSTCSANYSCNSSGSGCGSCVNTATTCTNVNNIGSVQTCVNGEWGTASSCDDVSCNTDMTACGECKNNTTSCSNNASHVGQLTSCTNGKKSTNACANNASCSNATTCGVCKDTATQCSGPGTQTCSNGAWGAATACQAPANATASCSNGTCNFSCDSGYTNNGKRCCQDVSHGSITIDNSTTSCNFTCDSGYCNNGTSCVDKQTDLNNCGTCGSVCTKSNSTSVSCTAGICIATACANDYTLIDGRCDETYCTENATKCENTGTTGKIYKCIQNEWVAQNDCPSNYSCNSDESACGECINTAKKCDDDIGSAYICEDGSWGTGTSCNNSSCNGTVCGSCQNGSSSCSNDNKIGQVSICRDGNMGAPSSCNTVSCDSEGKVCGACKNDNTMCDGNTLKTCSLGAYDNGITCGYGCGMVSGTFQCYATCTPGTKRCAGSVLETCKTDGSDYITTNCTNGCGTVSGTAQCYATCSPGSTTCSGNTLKTCNSTGSDYTSTNCTNGCGTVSGTAQCYATCSPGSTKCSGNNLQTCNSTGSDYTTTTCSNGCGTVSGTAQCYTNCSPGSTTCDGSTLKTCNSAGSGYSNTTCDYGCGTVSGTAQCYTTCSPGSTTCSGSTLKTCNGTGSGYTNTTCDHGCGTVSGTAQCYTTCSPGSKQCSGNNLQTCNSSGSGWDTSSCTYGCNTSTNACYPQCKPNTQKCTNARIYTCTSSGNWNSGTDCDAPPVGGTTICSGNNCDLSCNKGYVRTGSWDCTKITSCDDGDYIYYTTSSGSEVLAYCLKDEEVLTFLAKAINDENHPYPEDNENNAYVLANDITINAADWPGIGTSKTPFTGHFYGGNHILRISSAKNGIFGDINKGTVADLKFKSIINTPDDCTSIGGLSSTSTDANFYKIYGSTDIKGTCTNVGGLIGTDKNSTFDDSVFEYIDTHSDLSATADNIGGFIGSANKSVIRNSSASYTQISSNSNKNAGIFIGDGTSITISDVDSCSCSVTAATNAGGIAGSLKDSNVRNVSSACNVTAVESGIAGGLVGKDTGSTYTHSVANLLNNSIKAGSGKGVGGFVGNAATSSFTSCVVIGYGTFLSSTGERTGGFAGNSGYSSYRECVAIGKLSGKKDTGGFIGYGMSDQIDYSIAAGSVIGKTYSGGFIGTSELTSFPVTINNSYSLSALSTGVYYGGFAGNAKALKVNTAYWYDTPEWPAIGTGESFDTLKELDPSAVPEFDEIGIYKSCTFDMSASTSSTSNQTFKMPIPKSVEDLVSVCK